MKSLYYADRPLDDLDDKALQSKFKEVTGMNIFAFISKRHSQFVFKRNRKIWTGPKYQLELSPMKVEIKEL